jgi:hypothetical protein
MQKLDLPDHLFYRLQELTGPLVPTRADVIERLLEHFDKTRPQIPAKVTAANNSISPLPREASVSGRAPRERGATIELDGHEMRVISVRDMYEQVLKFILDKGHSNRLKPLIPFNTSRERYLIADEPIHPNGNNFVIAVKYGGYFMEAHKDYKNAVEHLRRLTDKLGLKFKYVG